MMTRVLSAILWKTDVPRALLLRDWIVLFGVATMLVMTLAFEAHAIEAAFGIWR